MEPTAQLGQRLRNRRSALGLTLMAVAIRAGVSVPYVANLEKGRGNPTLDVVVSLAEALELAPADLVGAASSKVSGAATPAEELPAVLVEYGRGRVFRRTTARLAELAGRPVEDMRATLLAALRAAPRPVARPLSRKDCRRVLDAYLLVLADPE